METLAFLVNVLLSLSLSLSSLQETAVFEKEKDIISIVRDHGPSFFTLTFYRSFDSLNYINIVIYYYYYTVLYYNIVLYFQALLILQL